MQVTLGKQIRVMRTLRGINQGELAKLVGICQPTLSEYENDKSLPSEKTLQKIKAALIWPSDGQIEVALAILANDGTQPCPT